MLSSHCRSVLAEGFPRLAGSLVEGALCLVSDTVAALAAVALCLLAVGAPAKVLPDLVLQPHLF